MPHSSIDIRHSPSGVAYRVIDGAGPWLVLCHGMALDHTELTSFACSLSDDWRVLLWDMPGHGASVSPQSWSLGSMTDALEEVLHAAGVDHCTLLGFSFGGMVAQSFVRRHPSRVDALIAYGCFAPFIAPAPIPRSLIGAAVAATVVWRPWSKVRSWFARHCAQEPSARAFVEAAADRLGKHGMAEMTRALLSSFEPDTGFRVDCPLLLVRGERDANRAGIDVGFAALRSRARHVETAGIAEAGHCAHLDRPEEFARAVRPFLDRVKLGAHASNRSSTD